MHEVRFFVLGKARRLEPAKKLGFKSANGARKKLDVNMLQVFIGFLNFWDLNKTVL